MSTAIYARQGDLVIEKTDEPSVLDGYNLTTDYVLAGSHDSQHIVKGKLKAKKDDRRIFLMVPEPTVITHGSRHKDVPLVAGHYTVTPLRERHDGADRDVED